MRRQDAFTLVEVLVALAIFGFLSAMAYALLGQTLGNADTLTERMDRMQAVQRTVQFLSDDLLQAAPRPVRLELGDSVGPAVYTSLSGDFALEVTHGGWGNPAGLPRGTQQRVAYRLEDGELLRYYWTVLDRTLSNEPVATVLLDDVDSLVLRYLSGNDQWSDTWPPQGVSGPAALRSRPRAVEFILTLPDEGEIRRLLEVAP